MVDEFADISDAMGAGVYMLYHHERVVFVGYSTSMIDLIAGHRRLAHKSMPTWFPIVGIIFDRAHILPCGPDRAAKLMPELIAHYQPHYNTRRLEPQLRTVPCTTETTVPRESIRSAH